VDSGEKMRFSLRTHTGDVRCRDRTYGLSLHGGSTYLMPDVWSLVAGKPYFHQMFVFLDLGLL
jgi:hypothetical protein